MGTWKETRAECDAVEKGEEYLAMMDFVLGHGGKVMSWDSMVPVNPSIYLGTGLDSPG